MDKFVTKRIVIVLASMCLVLAASTVALSVALAGRPRSRFSPTDKTFVMFDNKTAQACWSGRKADKHLAEMVAKYGLKLANPSAEDMRDAQTPTPLYGLPYCVDLK